MATKVQGILPPYKDWPYWGRFITIVAGGTALNVIGLLATQVVGWSIFFFDMAGTAFASLLGGAVAGLLVAILTGSAGGLLVSPQYYIFSVVNIAGALAWAILPRLGRPGIGAGLFDPFSYRRGMINIVLVGLIVGCICSVVAFVVHAHVLNLTDAIDPANSAKSGLSGITDAGTNTSRNIVTVIRETSEMLVNSSLPGEAIIAAITIAINVADKIIATVTAVTLIVMFGNLPKFSEQKKFIRKRSDLVNSKFIDHRAFLLALFVIQVGSITYVTWQATHNITSLALIAGFSLAIFCVVIFADPSYLRSLDREVAIGQANYNRLFYNLPFTYELKSPREVFEDLLKIIVVIASAVGFFIASFAHAPSFCTSENMKSFADCGALYQLAVVNILILTGYRYVLVLLMRMFGRV